MSAARKVFAVGSRGRERFDLFAFGALDGALAFDALRRATRESIHPAAWTSVSAPMYEGLALSRVETVRGVVAGPLARV